MTPQAETRLSTLLMYGGIGPLVLGFLWMLDVIAFARHHPGSAGASDAFLMMAVLAFAYLFAFVVSGAGALLSLHANRRAAVRSPAIRTARRVVVVVLVLPVLFVLSIPLLPR